ncbi:MAG: Smr/MutS family protein [Erythrobacter sp.]|nr:Smr/MutS family protein [Erythrobacter sp.]
MSAPRGLSTEEAEAWEKVAATVKPLDARDPPRKGEGNHAKHDGGAAIASGFAATPPKASPKPRVPLHHSAARHGPPPRSGEVGLDSHWERRLKGGTLAPDFTLDLHGHGLDAAYSRLMSGVAQARAMEARTILLVTGKPRPVAAADRGSSRGAIRAKVLDWLAASSHHSAIAAVRTAHRKHGGDGALYIVLKRER